MSGVRTSARRRVVFAGLLWIAACASDSDDRPAPGGPDASVASDAAASDATAGDANDAAPDDSGMPDAAPDAAVDAGAIDPWNPPLEGPVDGVATHDGWEPPRFVPPPVDIDGGWTDSVMVTADARRLYFAYSRLRFDAALHGTVLIDGPARPGMTVDDFRIFQADLGPQAWTTAYHPVNSPDPNYAQASASVNVAGDLMVFTQWAHDGGFTGDLYYAEKNATGWAPPSPLPVNTACNEDNGFVVGSVATGVTLYFESDRVDDAGTACGGKKHIFYTTYADGGFGPVARVAGLNGAGASDEDQQVFVAPDEKSAIWTATRTSPGLYGIVTADRATSAAAFSGMRTLLAPSNFAPPFAGKLVFIGEANVAEVPEGWIMYLMCGIAHADDDAGAPADVRLRVCFSRKPRT